jgi:hypothetical protein
MLPCVDKEDQFTVSACGTFRAIRTSELGGIDPCERMVIFQGLCPKGRHSAQGQIEPIMLKNSVPTSECRASIQSVGATTSRRYYA